MPRFDAFLVALHVRVFPQCKAAISRIQWPLKEHNANYTWAMRQKPLLYRSFTSIIESRSEALDHGHDRKVKKLLEPSLFDNAVTFEQAFGENVIASTL
jgi:hypothetical protein